MSGAQRRGAAGIHNIVAALQNRDYLIFAVSHVPGLIGMWAQRVAIGWVAWELTKSPAWLGVIAMADLLPAIFLAPISGAVADRMNVAKMMVFTQIFTVTHASLLWLLTLFGLMDIWLLFGLALLLGVNNPFSTAARHNLVPLLVPQKDLAAAISFNSLNFNLARFLGPALAGIVIAMAGPVAVFAIEMLAECGLLIALRFFKVRPQPRKTGRGGLLAMARDIREGVVYVAGHGGIGPVLMLLLFSAITSRPSLELLPGFADAVFERGAQGLGWLGASVGAGGILGSIWLARRGAIKGMTNLVIMQTLAMNLSLIVFALAGNFWVALPFMALTGFFLVGNGTGTQVLLQWAVDPMMRGRVMSIYTLLFRGMPALGALLIGFAADHLGLQETVAGASLLSIGFWVWAYRRRHRTAAAMELPPPDERESYRPPSSADKPTS
ncbi:MAG TPA: MFS transporter [Alphaproteobacteria bacterium]|nr:MFS transporter [Alphaproteobacteria bacterium]